jgi:Fe-S-cluster containining protein
MTPDRAKELCAGCGRCCKYLLAFYPDGVGADMREEFLLARGAVRDRIKDQRGLTAWLIPSVCQHLTKDNACDIYEARPQACKDFDGRSHPGAAREPIACAWIGEV